MKVSILTPSFNQAGFLPRCLASVAAQRASGLSVEHVLYDAASTDGTKQILESWPGPELLWVSESDRGQSDALNKALERASGDVIGWLNVDEYYEPGVLQEVCRVFADNPDVVLVYGDFRRVTAVGEQIRVNRQWDYDQEVGRIVTPIAQTCASFMRASRVREVGGFDEQWNYVMDWDLFIRLMRDGQPWVRIPRILGNYAMHPAAKTSSAPGEFLKEIDGLRSRELPHMPPEQINWYRRWQCLRMVWHMWRCGVLYEKVTFKLFRQRRWQEEFGSPGPVGVLMQGLRARRRA